MSEKIILTVIGATGAQGGSVIDTVLSRPDLAARYALRGISRNPSSDKAKALSAKGVEVIKAELDDIESLEAAISGSSAVFGVTDFWATMSKVRETEQGKNIFAACQAANVKHLVWSSLPNVAKLSNGRRSLVDHFDSKAEVEEFIESNKGSMIASYFMPAIFVAETVAKDSRLRFLSQILISQSHISMSVVTWASTSSAFSRPEQKRMVLRFRVSASGRLRMNWWQKWAGMLARRCASCPYLEKSLLRSCRKRSRTISRICYYGWEKTATMGWAVRRFSLRAGSF